MAFPTLLMVVVEVVSVGLPVESLTGFLDFTDPFFDAVVVDIKVSSSERRYSEGKQRSLRYDSQVSFTSAFRYNIRRRLDTSGPLANIFVRIRCFSAKSQSKPIFKTQTDVLIVFEELGKFCKSESDFDGAPI
jgi:hypothetical protein